MYDLVQDLENYISRISHLSAEVRGQRDYCHHGIICIKATSRPSGTWYPAVLQSSPPPPPPVGITRPCADGSFAQSRSKVCSSTL